MINTENSFKELKEVIINYSKKYINETNDWYSWREINEDKLPKGIKLPDGNQYIKNIVITYSRIKEVNIKI